MLIFKTVQVVDHKATGDWARCARVKQKLSLRTAAGLAGLTPSYLSELENGTRAWKGLKAIDYCNWLETRLRRLGLID